MLGANLGEHCLFSLALTFIVPVSRALDDLGISDHRCACRSDLSIEFNDLVIQGIIERRFSPWLCRRTPFLSEPRQLPLEDTQFMHCRREDRIPNALLPELPGVFFFFGHNVRASCARPARDFFLVGYPCPGDSSRGYFGANGAVSALRPPGGLPPPSLSEAVLSPFSIRQIYRFFRPVCCWPPGFIAFCRIAAVMSCLEVVPIVRCCFRRIISEFSPSADRFYLIDYKGQRMLCIAWLIVMDLSEPSSADPARCAHRSEACPIFPSQTAVLIPRVCSHLSPSGNSAMIALSHGLLALRAILSEQAQILRYLPQKLLMPHLRRRVCHMAALRGAI